MTESVEPAIVTGDSTMLGKIKASVGTWLLWVATWSPAIRFLATAIISALASAGAVGVITKFGAYWFVIRYRVRVPSDGIPYVAETASAIGFLLLACAGVAYFLAYYVTILFGQTVFRFTARLGHRMPNSRVQRSIVALLTTAPFVVAFFWVLSSPPEPGRIPLLFVIALQIAGGVGLLLESSMGATAGALTVAALTVLSSFALWYPPYYGWFLRTIGHGGGQHVTLQIEGQRDLETGYLLVRTGTALVMFDGTRTISEIPLGTVTRIDHDTAVYWCLPGCDCEHKGAESKGKKPSK